MCGKYGELIYGMLAKKGTIKRDVDKELWGLYQEVRGDQEFEEMKDAFKVDIVESDGNTLDLYPREGSIFCKTRAERKTDASLQYNKDLFMLDFVKLILLSLLLSGEEEQLMVRKFVTLEGFLAEMNDKCRSIEAESKASEEFDDNFGMNFLTCAKEWNSKPEGTPDANPGRSTRYAIINKAVAAFRSENLVVDYGHNRVKGTKRLETRATYMLRKEREKEIAEYIRKGARTCQ